MWPPDDLVDQLVLRVFIGIHGKAPILADNDMPAEKEIVRIVLRALTIEGFNVTEPEKILAPPAAAVKAPGRTETHVVTIHSEGFKKPEWVARCDTCGMVGTPRKIQYDAAREAQSHQIATRRVVYT
jgi:hypothetical protein